MLLTSLRSCDAFRLSSCLKENVHLHSSLMSGRREQLQASVLDGVNSQLISWSLNFACFLLMETRVIILLLC